MGADTARMPTRAAIYARRSRTSDGSESLDIQVEKCREIAERHGLDVIVELVEPPSTSGYKNRGRDRTNFNELIDLTRDGTVDHVIVYRTDLLSRGGPGFFRRRCTFQLWPTSPAPLPAGQGRSRYAKARPIHGVRPVTMNSSAAPRAAASAVRKSQKCMSLPPTRTVSS